MTFTGLAEAIHRMHVERDNCSGQSYLELDGKYMYAEYVIPVLFVLFSTSDAYLG
jgi:hypothetical protein